MTNTQEYEDPDVFRVGPSQSGVVHGYATSGYPRFSPEELRTLLRETWDAAKMSVGDGPAARDAYITNAVPARDWERNQHILPGL